MDAEVEVFIVKQPSPTAPVTMQHTILPSAMASVEVMAAPPPPMTHQQVEQVDARLTAPNVFDFITR